MVLEAESAAARARRNCEALEKSAVELKMEAIALLLMASAARKATKRDSVVHGLAEEDTEAAIETDAEAAAARAAVKTARAAVVQSAELAARACAFNLETSRTAIAEAE